MYSWTAHNYVHVVLHVPYKAQLISEFLLCLHIVCLDNYWEMAEKVVERARVEEQLNCSICLKTYTDPKLLQCFHVFCRQCLVPLGDRDQRGQLSLTCPTCRQVTPIPARGVAGLQSAFHINNLLEDSARKLENVPERETPTHFNPVNKASQCFVHEDKELELYCETCGELICYKCALKGDKHYKHDFEELNCSICLDTYTDPKILQCFHVFCRQCLVPLGVRDQRGQLSLTCPTCRQVTPIPARGAAGLQSAFHINNLLEILEDSSRNAPATPEGATPTDLNPVNKANYCFVHEGKELELYCETCAELICFKCVTKSGEHHNHDYEELNVAFEKYKEEITSSLEPMEKQVTTIKKALALMEQCRGEISNQRAVIEDNIHVTFRRLREVLTIRETELIGKLHQTTQGKLKGLAAQRDQIETTLAQLDSCLHFMRKSIKEGNESDVLMMKTNTVHQVKELSTPFQPDTLKPNTEANIVFSALADLTAMCLSYGQVFTSGSPDPSKCYITGKGLEVAVVGEKSTAILHGVSYEGKPCEEPIKSLECELVSEITGTRASCSVERRGQSQYKISYQPTIKGRHQLHIKMEGQHVRGSPSSVAVESPLGTQILTLGGKESL